MKDFRKLDVWAKSHALTLDIYAASKSFPREELFGLTNQIRRAAASVPANIAEGCGRAGDAELGRFCQIAMGSASELEYHLLLARDLGLLDPAVFRQLNQDVVQVKRMLATFISKLKS